MTDHVKELVALINKIAYMHTPKEVFRDFVEIAALSISNSVDPSQFEEREKRYLDLIRKYDAERQKLFPEAFAYLVEALESEAQAGTPSDVLGTLFMDMGLGDKGQFFTPQHICTMMGKMTFSENDKTIEERGYITLSEPCCGAGAMVLGFAQAMLDAKYDYTRQMVVTAVDTDIRCVHMCYVQLALYGIPAVVIHGDSLSVKEWSRWYTPLYMIGGWQWRQHCGITEPAKEPTPKVSPEQSITEGTQLNLFDLAGKDGGVSDG